MKSADYKELNYQFKTKVNMKTKTSILVRIKAFFILLVSGSLWWKTTIVTKHEDFVGWIKVTKCCKIGPITNENNCPNCGKRIIKQ